MPHLILFLMLLLKLLSTFSFATDGPTRRIAYGILLTQPTGGGTSSSGFPMLPLQQLQSYYGGMGGMSGMTGATGGMGSSPGGFGGWGGSPMGMSPYGGMGGYFPYGGYSALGMFGR